MILTHTRLETTPAGTANLGGIVNGNWSQLETLFDPALSSGAVQFNAFAKAFLRTATLPTDAAQIVWSAASGKFIPRAGIGALAAGATVTGDFLGALRQLCTLDQDSTIAFTNAGTGREIELLITADAATRALTWPSGPLNMTGAALPTSLASGQSLHLVAFCRDGTTAGIVFTKANLS